MKYEESELPDQLDAVLLSESEIPYRVAEKYAVVQRLAERISEHQTHRVVVSVQDCLKRVLV